MRIDAVISSESLREAGTTAARAEEIGFDAVDAGTIDESWRQQPGSPVYAKDFDAPGVRRALGQATKDRPPEFRAR